MDFNGCYALAGYRAYLAPDAGVYMLSDDGGAVLSEPLFADVLAELDGRRSCEEVTQCLSHRYRQEQVFYALLQLEAQGYIAPVEPSLGVVDSGGSKPMKPPGPPVRVHAVNPSDESWVTRVLNHAGLRVLHPEQDQTETDPIEIIVCRDYDDSQVSDLMEDFIGRGRCCLPLRVANPSLWLGPVFGRFETHGEDRPCWSCLMHAIRHNRPVEAHLKRREARPLGSILGSHLALRQSLAVAGHVLSRGLQSSTAEQPELDRHLLRVDLRTLECSWHVVRKRPQCPDCGDSELFARQVCTPVRLDACPTHFSSDGGLRTLNPEQTWSRLRHIVSPITGAITQMQPLGDAVGEMLPAIYGAAYHVSPNEDEITDDETFIRATFGKGRTSTQARASVMGEAIERLSAVYQGDEPIIRGTLKGLAPRAVDPRTLLNFSEEQYASRPHKGADLARDGIPLPFEDELELDWTPAWSLTHDAPRLLPASYCYGFKPTAASEQICGQNSNGHAAGNCREEAILQGLLELIERDAVSIWWYNRLQRPAIDLTSFGDPYFVAVKDDYQAQGWKLWVLDLTHDLDIPVVVAIIRHHQTGRYIVGFGAHLEPRLAVQRALTEVHQVLSANSQGPGLWTDADIEAPEFLHPNPGAGVRPVTAFAKAPTEDLRDSILHCARQLEDKGMELIVLDYSRADLVLRTLKVVVPGLRHFWPRFGPGRLYDVPVAMGWRPAPLSEDQLNPKPLLL